MNPAQAQDKKRIPGYIWVRLLLPCLLVLAITLCAALVGYGATNTLMMESIFERNEMLLRQSISVLNSELENISKLSYTISNSQYVATLLALKPDNVYGHTDALVQTRDFVYSATRNNDFIFNYGIYIEDSSILISNKFALGSGMKYFYGSRMSFGQYDQRQFAELLTRDYQHGVIHSPDTLCFDGETRNVMLYVQSLPYSKQINSRGALYFCLDMAVFDGLMSPIIDEHSSISIYNGGEKIYSLGSAERAMPPLSDLNHDSGYVSYGNSLITYVRDSSSGWLYTVAVPLSVAAGPALSAHTGYIGLMFIAAMVCLVFALISAYYTGRPLSSIISRMEEQLGDTPHSLHDVDDKLAALLSTSQQIQDSLDRNTALIRTVFLTRLTRDEFESDAQLLQFMHYGRLMRSGDYFALALVRLDDISTSRTASSILERLIARLNADREPGNSLLMLRPDSQRMLLLIPWQGNTADITRALDGMLTEMDAVLDGLNAPHDISVSAIHSSITELVAMYNEARIAFREPLSNGHGYHQYHSGLDDEPVFGNSEENELSMMIASGNADGCSELLARLIAATDSVSANSQLMILNDMRRTLIQLCTSATDASATDISRELLRLRIHDAAALRSSIQTAAMRLCKTYKSTQEVRGNSLTDSILQYLENNHSSPALSLSMLASEFGMNDVYLSQYIKEHTGENFTTHLERIRIDHACTIFESGEAISLDELALRIGYNSANTFRKAFKRVKGVTPSQWREFSAQINFKETTQKGVDK